MMAETFCPHCEKPATLTGKGVCARCEKDFAAKHRRWAGGQQYPSEIREANAETFSEHHIDGTRADPLYGEVAHEQISDEDRVVPVGGFSWESLTDYDDDQRDLDAAVKKLAGDVIGRLLVWCSEASTQRAKLVRFATAAFHIRPDLANVESALDLAKEFRITKQAVSATGTDFRRAFHFASRTQRSDSARATMSRVAMGHKQTRFKDNPSNGDSENPRTHCPEPTNQSAQVCVTS